MGSPHLGRRPSVPMWVLKVSNFLELKIFRSHKELLRLELLVQRETSMTCIFVSHQWVGVQHPDPEGRQLRILQEVLRSLKEGELRLELKDVASSFLWLDWFSVPQVTEDQNSEAGASPTPSLNSQDVQIQSIPYFVQNCQIFMALVPELLHESGEICNFASWLDRGWCRAEMWCQILSDEARPILVVTAGDEMAVTSGWEDALPLMACFSEPSDTEKISKMMKHLLRFRLRSLHEKGQLDLFRFWLARREQICGVTEQRTLRSFLAEFRFASRQRLGPLACAVLCGNEEILRELHQAGYPLSSLTGPIPEVGIAARTSLVLLAVKFSWRYPAVLRTLLELRANPNAVHEVHPLSLCKTAEDVELLIQHSADVNMKPLAHNPRGIISQACLNRAPVDVISKLLECNRVDTSTLSCAFTSLSMVANTYPHCKDVATILLNAKADVNFPSLVSPVPTGCLGRCLWHSQSPEPWRGLPADTTPLGIACWFGRPQLVELLLEARADPDIPNFQGRKPFDLAESRDCLFIALRRGIYPVIISKYVMV